MNSFQKLLACLFVVCVIISAGCNKGSDPVSCNYATELEAQATALTNAATVYGNDPTTANCNAYKNAYQDYIDALKGYEDCATTAGTHAEWQSAIDALQASLDTIQC